MFDLNGDGDVSADEFDKVRSFVHYDFKPFKNCLAPYFIILLCVTPDNFTCY